MPLRNSDLSYYMETQKTEFTADEVPLCPNGHGPMEMTSITQVGPVPEAFAKCGVCRHQMVCADERPQTLMAETH